MILLALSDGHTSPPQAGEDEHLVVGALRLVGKSFRIREPLPGEEPVVRGNGNTQQAESCACAHRGHDGQHSPLGATVHGRTDRGWTIPPTPRQAAARSRSTEVGYEL